MKKLFLLATTVMLLASPSLFAQQVNINEKGLLKKIERSDADIVNPKKENKAATWIARGETFYQAATEVSKNLYDGIDAATVMMLFGEPTGAEVVEIAGQPYNKGIFPYVDVYLDVNNKPISWVVTKEIYPDALGKATEAYSKAYQLEGSNPKVAEKVQAGLKKVYDEYSKTGALYYALAMYNEAAEQFIKAYDITKLDGITIPDSDIYTLLHDAGLSYLFAKDYPKSIECLTAAEKISNDAEIYYLIYHAFRGNAANDPEAIQKAKVYLEKGLSMYPSDTNIIESLSEAYVFLGEDPNQILSTVENALKQDPNNADMWSALGVLYVSQENYDKAIGAFTHMAQLLPDSYIANNNLGIVYIKKAEKILDDVNARAATFASQDEYDAELSKAFVVYAEAVPFLEKAAEIDPSNLGTIELLKNVTFRIREMDGMMEKCEKYNNLYKQMTGQM